MELVKQICELIIPRTDTPGAKDARVPAYIEYLLTTHYSDEERIQFEAGLTIFDEMARERTAKSFVDASQTHQKSILKKLDSGGGVTLATEVWRKLKQAVVFGYYTSESATAELQYDPIPGEYNGNIDLEEVGRAWLTTGI
ncbi:MAG: gluconate 2-dehydrogenase subunit 3 family protein [Hyphomonadaceae bacterium]